MSVVGVAVTGRVTDEPAPTAATPGMSAPGMPLPPPVDDGRRAAVLLRICRERMETEPDAAAELALRAIQRARTENDERVGAQAMLLLAQASYAAGHSPTELMPPLLVAIDHLTSVDDLHGLAEARLLLSRLNFEHCVLDEAANQAQLALNLAVRCGDLTLEANSAFRLATALADGGSYDGTPATFRRHFEHAADRFLSLNDRPNAVRSLINLAISSLSNGDPREAFRVSQRVMELLESPVGVLHATTHLLRAVASARMRWPGVAEAELAAAESIAQRVSFPAAMQLTLTFTRASVLASCGRLTEARQEFMAAAAGSLELQDLLRAADCYEQLSTVCELEGDFVGALSAARSRFDCYAKARARERDRRMQALEITSRLDEERDRSEALATSQTRLENAVDQARQELTRAERQLEWERSRRALVEMRAHRGSGVESLTGLPDLPAMAGRINELLESSTRLAIVVITVDDERVIAPMPDVRRRLIQEIAARTHAFLARLDGAFAGSLGSEDVVAVVPVDSDPSALQRSLVALHGVLSEPMDLIDVHAVAAVQLGVAIAPDHGIRPNGLLSRARLAAQAARTRRPGGPAVALFEESVEERQMLRTFVRERLRPAMEEGRVDVHYQPVVDAMTGRVISAEALVRWTDPDRGPISPAQFIPLAEETELIVELGGYVMQRACRAAATWPAGADGRRVAVSVNVSASQLTDGRVLDQVDAALLDSGLPPELLAIELTETTLARSDESAKTLKALRERGIQVEIDDFGTGYSSFSYLTNFPVDAVKIDKSFVDRIAVNVDDAAITLAIIQMAHSLRLSVIAEGIESEGQLDVLRSQGCDAVQGYFFAKPMPGADWVRWMEKRVLEAVL